MDLSPAKSTYLVRRNSILAINCSASVTLTTFERLYLNPEDYVIKWIIDGVDGPETRLARDEAIKDFFHATTTLHMQHSMAGVGVKCRCQLEKENVVAMRAVSLVYASKISF